MRRGGARRAEIGLLLGSLLAALLMLEVGIRLSGAGPAKPTGYAPVRTRANALPVNSKGYRDLERAVPKPPGVRRLLVVGDSFAWGYGLHFEDAFPQRLERGLTRRRRETWEVVNLAMPGLRTVEEARVLGSDGWAYQPDAVLLAFVLNDAEEDAAITARTATSDAAPPAASLWERSALLAFVGGRLHATAENRERISRYRSMYGEGASGWTAARRALQQMAGECRAHGVPFVIVIFPLFANPLDDGYPFGAAHEAIGQAGRSVGATVVDLLPAYRGLRWDLLVVDGTADEHPNEIAHRIAGDTLVRALDDVLPWSSRSEPTVRQ